MDGVGEGVEWRGGEERGRDSRRKVMEEVEEDGANFGMRPRTTG